LLLDTPREVEVRIPDIRAADGSDVCLLGSDERLAFRQSGDDLIIRLPAQLPNQPVHAIRMSVPT
jgi:hypothetical protein